MNRISLISLELILLKRILLLIIQIRLTVIPIVTISAHDHTPQLLTEGRRHHHPSLDGVVNLLGKTNRDIALVQNRLDKDFQLSYPSNANPSKITARIKKMQEDLVMLKEMCRELLAEKQIISEWKSHIRVKTGDQKPDEPEDINSLLFSARV